MKKSVFIFSLVVVALISSCRNKSDYKPNITGAMGEVLMVMDDRWRNSSPGESMRDMLQQPMEGLPQAEPLFDLSIIPHRAFSGTMRTFRNLIVTNIGADVEEEGVKFFNESSWARGQAMVHINARTMERFLEIIDQNEIRILGFLIRTERQRSLNYYTKYINADLTTRVNQKWQMRMVVPTTFSQNRSTDTFTWMSAETPASSQGVLIYSFDYIGEGTFSREYLLNKRDSVLMHNVPGSAPGSYMSTEYALPVTYKTLKVNEHEVVELRGLWKVVGDLMGGPFVMFAHHDKANNRVVVTDGYVYAPEKPNKRNLLWQVESVLYSVQFPGSSKSDATN